MCSCKSSLILLQILFYPLLSFLFPTALSEEKGEIQASKVMDYYGSFMDEVAIGRLKIY